MDEPLYPTFDEVVRAHNEIVEDGRIPASLPLHPDKLLELVAELDFMARNGEREAVIELFAEWLRWNVAPLDAEGSVPVD